MYQSFVRSIRLRLGLLVLSIAATMPLASLAFGQAPNAQIRELPPNQSIEREIAGAEAHRYRIELRRDEFFQVRVEQKGADVLLKLLDANRSEMARMDSPNGKQGPETLSFVSARDSNYTLEVSEVDAKGENGSYLIQRSTPRAATALDRRRVDVERAFAEGVQAVNKEGQKETAVAKLEEALRGWEDLHETYLTELTLVSLFLPSTQLPLDLVREAQNLSTERGQDWVSKARNKLFKAIELSRQFRQRLDGKVYTDLLAKAKSAKAEWQSTADHTEATSLSELANSCFATAEWEEKVKYQKLALSVFKGMRSDSAITSSKNFIALESLIKLQEAGLLSSLATTLGLNLGELREALDADKQALKLFRELQAEDERFKTRARFDEVITLNSMGQILRKLDDLPAALEAHYQALERIKRIPQQESYEALILENIASAHFSRFDYSKALFTLNEEMKIVETLGDKSRQADILGYFKVIYLDLGDEKRSREYVNRELAILVSPDYVQSIRTRQQSTVVPDIEGQAAAPGRGFATTTYQEKLVSALTLLRIAGDYVLLDQHNKALLNYEKALPLARELKEELLESVILSSIADVYVKQHKWEKAFVYSKQSLALDRRLPQKSDLAVALRNTGFAYLEAGKPREALPYFNESLAVWYSLGAGKSEAAYRHFSPLLNHLARSYDALHNRSLAIVFGKLAVNALQQERGNLKQLEVGLQKSYIKKNEKPYRRLADWLIADGRIAEAEQVLAMLKEDEYIDYVRRDDKVAKELDQLSLNADQRGAFNRYEEFADRITAIARERDDLEIEKARWRNEAKAKGLSPNTTFPRQVELETRKKQVDDATTVFVKFLENINVTFKARTQSDVRVAMLPGTQTLLAKLKQPHTVIISTIVGEDRLNLIVATESVSRAHTVDIKAEVLNRRVEEFRQAVVNPTVDPRPAGKNLYDVLFPPALQKDLAGVQADTIVWSLDGTLRYVPIAALWDGKQYLTEKYSNVVITLARQDLREPHANRSAWTALGLGVSKSAVIQDVDGRPKPFPALPGVPEELCGVINDPQARCAGLHDGKPGVIDGNTFLDEDFTLQTFQDRLGDYPVVHVASHFSLNAGDYGSSYLLIGGGSDAERKLTLEMVRLQLRGKFSGVELLTLSACNTAISAGEDKSNGLEVEGFGVLAQELGAESVLASLWSVADPSTRDLMTEFYRILKLNPQISKAEALRKAQLALLQGRYKPGELPLWRRGPTVDKSSVHLASPFKRDDNAPYAHPYFWSPFVLMGNWR